MDGYKVEGYAKFSTGAEHSFAAAFVDFEGAHDQLEALYQQFKQEPEAMSAEYIINDESGRRLYSMELRRYSREG